MSVSQKLYPNKLEFFSGLIFIDTHTWYFDSFASSVFCVVLCALQEWGLHQAGLYANKGNCNKCFKPGINNPGIAVFSGLALGDLLAYSL